MGSAQELVKSGTYFVAVTNLTRLLTNWTHEVVKYMILSLVGDDDAAADDEVAAGVNREVVAPPPPAVVLAVAAGV